MRNTLFLVLGFALLVVQANVFRVASLLHFALDRLHVAVPFPAVTPSLLLPLIVFMGVHEYSLWRGAAIACVLGYATDLVAGAPIGRWLVEQDERRAAEVARETPEQGSIIVIVATNAPLSPDELKRMVRRVALDRKSVV